MHTTLRVHSSSNTIHVARGARRNGLVRPILDVFESRYARCLLHVRDWRRCSSACARRVSKAKASKQQR